MEHIKNNYINTGKIVGPVENSSSPDMLTRVTTINFATIEDAHAFRNDPELAEERMEKQEYDAINGIIFSDNMIRD